MTVEKMMELVREAGHEEVEEVEGDGRLALFCRACGQEWDPVRTSLYPMCTDLSCPGCGNVEGDGYDPDCFHPEGCGFFKMWGAELTTREDHGTPLLSDGDLLCRTGEWR